ncbi:MAG: hypothetical protein GU362_04660 [Thaumarchaeota archaeon]|nr:hypothetical protein [Nitrososphaerota archaeon]
MSIYPFHEVLQALFIYNMIYICRHQRTKELCVDSLPAIILYTLPYEIVYIEGVLVPAYVE